MNAAVSGSNEDFSLVLGGPLYQIYRRSRLLQPPIELVNRRIVAIILVTWLPLLLLTAIAGTTTGGVKVPFLYDLDAHIRLLLALPLLVWAELFVHRRMRLLVLQFSERGIVVPEDRARYDAIINAAVRMRNSAAIEVALLAVSTTLGYWIWRQHGSLHVGTWYAGVDASGEEHLTLAGWWYALVSLNVFRFVLFRWYYRLIIWYVFLWRVSRLPLRLEPLHPDRAGGIGFVGDCMRALAPVLLAHSVALSGAIGGRIWHEGAKLPEFQAEIALVIALLIVLGMIPLTFFGVALNRAGLQGKREYGLLAARYVDGFRAKWIQGKPPEGEPLVGSADIQSLADLANAYDVVQEMRTLPVSWQTVVRLAILIAVPFAPLMLTIFPFNELIGRLVGMLV